MKIKLQALLEKKTSELTISYTRIGWFNIRNLRLLKSLREKMLLKWPTIRMIVLKSAGVHPENSDERSTCKRQASAYQQKTMQLVRKWFTQRLHPPT